MFITAGTMKGWGTATSEYAKKAYSLQYLTLKSNFLNERSQVLTDLLKMQVFQDVTQCYY
jgi:hypothetical protein